MAIPIRSPQNPQIKQMVKLRQARARHDSGCTRLDGAREISRFLDAGMTPEVVYVQPEHDFAPEARAVLERCREAETLIQPVAEPVYRKLQFGDRDEGLAARVAWSVPSIENVSLGPRPLVLLLEGIEKPGNLGAIARTADAAGVDALVLVDPAIDPTNPNAIRASLGTVFTVNLFVAQADAAANWIAEQALPLYAAIAQESTSYADLRYGERVALLMGSEHAGLPEVWRQRADFRIHIPMHGAADSLNVSSAAAVLLFEVVRQRAR